MTSWYIQKGPDSDVVVSSRVRLARNFREYPFPMRMTEEQRKEVMDKTKKAVIGTGKSAGKSFLYMDINGLPPIERQVLVEKHLISPDLAGSNRGSSAIISRDEKTSIMINEEDHLRIQCMYPGLQLEEAWNMCSSIDDGLERQIEYAFNERYGYLTSCPTNIGTGLRASAMLHLPALVMTGYISNILEACGKLGIAVRGLYGENTETSGNLFQISNQVTLGASEEELIHNITNVANQIIEQERGLRSELYKQNPYRLEDKVFRSYGIFRSARIMSGEEGFKLISDVRLGIDMGIIKDMNIEKLNEIMLLIQPANVQKVAGKPLSPDERDVKRAELIREKLNN